MLGKDIIPSSVEISGIDGKNTATVRFYFWPDTILTTFIYGVEDGICSIHDQKQQLFNPEYRLIQ